MRQPSRVSILSVTQVNFTIPPTTQKRAPGRAVYLSFALAMVVLSGCNSSTANASADSGKKGKGRGGGAGGAVPVVVATAVQRDVPIEIQAVGTVEAYKTISVKSQIAGQITDIYFNEGDYVKAGDKLFRIDPRLYEAQLAQAQANKEKAWRWKPRRRPIWSTISPTRSMRLSPPTEPKP